MYTLYSALLAILLILTLPYWLLQMVRHGKYRAGLRQRFGAVPPGLTDRGENDGERPVIWVHAVSVGEVIASSAVIAELREKLPSCRVLISTTTSTGQKLAGQRFGAENVFYFPLDFAFAIQPYLKALRPQLVVVAETEFWPNFLWLAKRSGSHIAVINCRISDRSFPGYKRFRFWLPQLLEKTLANVDCFLAQTEEDRKRLIAIGASESKVTVTGNLKFDVLPPPLPEIVARLRESFTKSGAGPILVCGSTLEGEEGSLLSAFRNVLVNHPKAVMILAPRHPERFAEVATLVEKSRLPHMATFFVEQRLSKRTSKRRSTRRRRVSGRHHRRVSRALFAGDSRLSSVAASCRAADTIFLSPHTTASPIVTGNHYDNFRDIVNCFASRNAVRIVGLAELPLVFMELIDNDEERATLGRNALAALEAQRGATANNCSRFAPTNECEFMSMNPLTTLYGAATALRNTLFERGVLSSRRLEQPVVSVGNLSVGGSGKTPFVIALGELLQAQKIPFDVLSRGYRRKTRGVLVVDPDGSASDFGDEPLLIARRLGVPVIVGGKPL